MRISDWSSDVCSSDLLNHLAVDIHRMRRIVPPDRLDCRSQPRAVDQYAGHAMRRFGGGQSGLYAGLVGYIHPDENTANRLCMRLAYFFVEIEDSEDRKNTRLHSSH